MKPPIGKRVLVKQNREQIHTGGKKKKKHPSFGISRHRRCATMTFFQFTVLCCCCECPHHSRRRKSKARPWGGGLQASPPPGRESPLFTMAKCVDSGLNHLQGQQKSACIECHHHELESQWSSDSKAWEVPLPVPFKDPLQSKLCFWWFF